MRLLHWFLGTSLAHSPFASAAAITKETQPIVQITRDARRANLTLGNPPDRRFGIGVDYDLPLLTAISCLMNAVNGLAILAELDLQSRLPGALRITLSRYSEVEVEFEPVPPATHIDVRIMIWGLYAGIYDMLVYQKWKTAEFDLYWRSVSVAWIRFEMRRRAVGTSVESLDSRNRSDSTLSVNSTGSLWAVTNDITTARIMPDDEVPAVQFFYLPSGEAIAAQTVFITVLATLRNLAEFSVGDIIVPFESGEDGFDATIRFLPERHPRTMAPFNKYRWAIDAVRQIPGYMLAHKMFAELAIVMTVDGVTVGTGMLRKRNAGPEYRLVSNVRPNVNVSVS